MSNLALGAGWKTLTVSLGLMSTYPSNTPDGAWMLTWEATDKRASTPGYLDRMSFFIVTDLESGFAGSTLTRARCQQSLHIRRKWLPHMPKHITANEIWWRHSSYKTAGGEADAFTLMKAGFRVLTTGMQPSCGHANLAVLLSVYSSEVATEGGTPLQEPGVLSKHPLGPFANLWSGGENIKQQLMFFFFPLTILLRLFNYLLALFAALGVGQDEPQSDRDEGPQPPQGVMGRRLDQLLSSKLLLVEHVLVLHLQRPRPRIDSVG